MDQSAANRNQWLEKIKNEPNMKKLMKLGREVPMDPAFDDPVHKLNVMFSITYLKFRQNINMLQRLLYDTGSRPIWHMCDDLFWGTRRSSAFHGAAGERVGSRINSNSGVTMTEDASQAAPPTPTERPWYIKDNWNGRILCVVRALLRPLVSTNPKALQAAVEAEFRKHCPFPDDYLSLPPDAIYDSRTALPPGTIIAGQFRVELAKRLKGTGSFVGDYCYICEDVNPRDPSEEETIREALEGQSLAELRNALWAAISVLSTAGTDGPEWHALMAVVDAHRPMRFFGNRPRRWWLALEDTVRRAAALAPANGDRAPLRAAHVLRQLLPSPPLWMEASRPRIFVKTFREYGPSTFAEVRRCSAKAPDFGRKLDQGIPSWPVRAPTESESAPSCDGRSGERGASHCTASLTAAWIGWVVEAAAAARCRSAPRPVASSRSAFQIGVGGGGGARSVT